MTFKDLPFLINPRLRLSSPYLRVEWIAIDLSLLEHEAGFPSPNREVYLFQKRPGILRETGPDTLRFYYSDSTDFNRLGIQQWLRGQIKYFVEQVASAVLPVRLHELEREKKLHCRNVCVETLPKDILGQCSSLKDITLSPKLALFPKRMSDAVMLHELAHLRHLNHRKGFWAYLSVLLGEDANEEKFKSDIAYCEHRDMIDFLLK